MTPREYAVSKERGKESAAREANTKETTGRDSTAGRRDDTHDGDGSETRLREGTQTSGPVPRRDSAAEGVTSPATAGDASAPWEKGQPFGRDAASDNVSGRPSDIGAAPGPDQPAITSPDRVREAGPHIAPGGSDVTYGAAANARTDSMLGLGDGQHPEHAVPGRDGSGLAREQAPEDLDGRDRVGDVRADASPDEVSALRKRIAELEADKAEQNAKIAGLDAEKAELRTEFDDLKAANRERDWKDRTRDLKDRARDEKLEELEARLDERDKKHEGDTGQPNAKIDGLSGGRADEDRARGKPEVAGTCLPTQPIASSRRQWEGPSRQQLNTSLMCPRNMREW